MHFNPLTPDNDPTNPFFHPLNQNLNEEKFTKARVMFKGSPSHARRDMRVAKQTGLYDRMTEKPSGKGRVYEITFKSEGQFRRFMSQFEVDLMEYPLKEDVQLDEVTGETTVMAKGDRNQYERITRALTAAKKAGKIAGYEGAHYNFKTKVLTLIFDSKAHKPASQRRKVAKMIKDFGLEFSHSIEEGFASDAQRRAAFASGYKAKGKKKKKDEEGEAVPPEDTPFGRFGEITGLHYVPDVIADRLAGDPMAILRARREAGTHVAPGTGGEFVMSRDGSGIKPPFPDPRFPMNPSDRRYYARAEEEFTKSQLSRLKKEYDKINNINPESPTYKKLKDKIRKMDTKMLQQIYDAKIKFMRGLAFNELSRRGKQPKV